MANRLDEESREEFTESFNKFAKKMPGRCNPSEFQSLMRHMGKILSDGEILEAIKSSGGSDSIDLNQFLNYMGSVGGASEDTAEDIVLAFSVFDKEGNGLISTSELRYVLTACGDKLNDEEVTAMLNASDPSGTGAMRYEPFVRDMLSKIKQ